MLVFFRPGASSEASAAASGNPRASRLSRGGDADRFGTTRDDVIFTRDLVLAELAIKLADAPVVYEAHTVASVFAEERARMYEGVEPPSKRKRARLDAREARVCRGAAGVVTITSALLESLETRHGPIGLSRVIRDGCRASETPLPPLCDGRPQVY